MRRTTTYAPDVYRALNGFCTIYKPLGVSCSDVFNILRTRLTDQLNELDPRPLNTRLAIEGKFDQEKKLTVLPNLADHPLVVGPRYLPWELRMWMGYPSLGYNTTGVIPILIGKSYIRKYKFKMIGARLINIYELKSQFGFATTNAFASGHIVDKSPFNHIRSGYLESVINKIQTTQRNRLFDAAALPWDSQQAYELAKAWPSRPPKMASWPVIYNIKLKEFNLPDFTLEVIACNSSDQYLANLINDIGLIVKSKAIVKSIRRVSCGPFKAEESLSEKQFDLQSVVDNISYYSTKQGEIQGILQSYHKDLRLLDHEVFNQRQQQNA